MKFLPIKRVEKYMVSLMKLLNIFANIFKWLQIMLYAGIVFLIVYCMWIAETPPFFAKPTGYEFYMCFMMLIAMNYYGLNFIRGLFEVESISRSMELENTSFEYKRCGRYRIICKWGRYGVYDILRFRYLIPIKYDAVDRLGNSMYACKLHGAIEIFNRKGKRIYSE